MAFRVLFVRDHDVRLSIRRHVSYRRDQVAILTDEQTHAAREAGAIEVISDKTPRKRNGGVHRIAQPSHLRPA